MKVLRILLVALLSVVLAFSLAFADKAVKRGKKLFNDAKAFGGEKACSECHPDGRGLEMSGTKTKFNLGGEIQNSLEEAMNYCIVNANKGKAIDVKSKEMKDLVAYIKSLGKEKGAESPGYK